MLAALPLVTAAVSAKGQTPPEQPPAGKGPSLAERWPNDDADVPARLRHRDGSWHGPPDDGPDVAQTGNHSWDLSGAAAPTASETSVFAVRAFGTAQTCMGAVDDTEAIQRAANAAAKAGGIVALPSGHCLVSSEIVVPGNSVWFRGSGRGATIIQARSHTTNVFHCAAEGGTSRFHAKFSDLQIAGGFRSIWIDRGCSSSVIENVMMTDPVIGLQINGDDRAASPVATISTYVRNLEISYPADYGIYAFETGEIFLSTIVIDGKAGRASADVLFDSHANAIYAERLNLLAAHYGLLIQDVEHPTTPQQRPSQMFIDTVLGDSCIDAGIYVKDGYQLFFDKPWASGSSKGPGLLVGPNAEELEFDDGTFVFNDKDGVDIQGPRTGRLNLNGGRAISNGRSSPGVYDGVSIEPGAENFRIDGLSAYNGTTQGYGATQRFGLRLQAGPSDHFIVANSLMTDNLVGAVWNQASGADYAISNVTGYATTGDGGQVSVVQPPADGNPVPLSSVTKMVLIDPSAPLPRLALALPASPSEHQRITVMTTQPIAELSALGPGGLVAPRASLGKNRTMAFVWNQANGSWFVP